MSPIACISSVVYAVGSLACFPDEQESYSTPVGLNLEVDSDQTENGVASDTKLIQVEIGNPYALFVAAARERIGRDPSAIGVDHIDLRLGAESSGVTTLGEVFAGNVEVLFQTLISDNSYPVASVMIDATTPAGPIDLAITFEPSAIPDADYIYMLDGTFKVCLRGPAAPGFAEAAGASAELQLTLQFIAFH